MNPPAEAQTAAGRGLPPFWPAALRRTLPWFVVLVIWLMAGWTTLAWLQVDNTPPSWDPAVHLTHALYYWAYLTRLPLADAWAGLGLTSHYYPPLVHTAGAAALAIWGVIHPVIDGLTTADVPVLANLGFMGLLLFGTYSLAARYYGEAAGLLAALLVASYPILSGQSRLFLLDYPLTSCTVAAMALLAASRNLTDPVRVWPLGIVAGAALLCKWSFLFFFGPPLLLALRAGWSEVQAGERPGLTPVRFGFNLAVVLAGILLVAGPWYLSHPAATLRELTVSNQTWLIDDDPAVWTLAGLTYYPRVLLAEQIFLPFALLFVFGAALHWLQRERLEGGGLLASWLVTGAVVLWLVPNKDPRFSMPLLPAMAVLSCSWLAPEPPGRRASSRWRQARLGLLAVTALLALGEHHAIAWRPAGLPSRIGPAWAPLWSDQAALTNAPVRLTGWPEEQLAQDIARVTPVGGRVGILPNTAHLNFLTMRYYLVRQYLPFLLEPERVPQVAPVVHTRAPGETVAATIETLPADYEVLVTMRGDQGAHSALIDETVADLHRRPEAFQAGWQLTAERTMPGGERVGVWLRRGPAATLPEATTPPEVSAPAPTSAPTAPGAAEPTESQLEDADTTPFGSAGRPSGTAPAAGASATGPAARAPAAGLNHQAPSTPETVAGGTPPPEANEPAAPDTNASAPDEVPHAAGSDDGGTSSPAGGDPASAADSPAEGPR